MIKIGLRSTVLISLLLWSICFHSTELYAQAVYKVQKNDNLTTIAKKFKTTPSAIAKVNGIGVNSVIIPNQVLTLPGPSNKTQRFVEYQVLKGDNLAEIASKFKTKVSLITSDNNLLNANNIYAGQILKIRRNVASGAQQNRIYRVRSGDNLGSIAKKYGTSVKNLVRANNLKNANLIKPGQKIKIPSDTYNHTLGSTHGLPYSVLKRLRSVQPKSKKWVRIMIHHTGTPQGNFEAFDKAHRRRGMENGLAYHFLIGNGKKMKDGEIIMSKRWKEQLDGGHTQIKYLNATSIGICLVGNFQNQRPTSTQLKQLTALCRFLMARCGISEANITTHKVAYEAYKKLGTQCPGKYFDLIQFKKRL